MKEGLGLFIRGSSLDLVYLFNDEKRLRLMRAHTSHIEDAEPDKRKNALLNAFKEAAGQVMPPIKNITVCLAPEHVKLGRIKLSGLAAKGVKPEIEKYGKETIQARQDDLASYIIYTAKTKSDEKKDALFATCSRKIVEECIWAIESLRFSIKVVEPISLALLRILTLSKQIKKDKPVLILYLETAVSMNATVVKNNEIVLMKNIYLGRDALEPAQSFMVQVDDIVETLSKSPEGFNISKILVCGNANKGEWVARLRQKYTEIVELEDPAQAITGLPETSDWTAALGSALLALDKKHAQINFVQPKPSKIQKKHLIAIGAGILAIILVFVFGKLLKPAKELVKNMPGLEIGKTKGPVTRDIETIKLEGISADKDERFAIINNEVYNVGDTVGGYTVKAISIDNVELIGDKKVFKLFLYEGEGPANKPQP